MRKENLPSLEDRKRKSLDDDVSDEDDNYDETKDRNILKRIKKECPDHYEEFKKLLNNSNNDPEKG